MKNGGSGDSIEKISRHDVKLGICFNVFYYGESDATRIDWRTPICGMERAAVRLGVETKYNTTLRGAAVFLKKRALEELKSLFLPFCRVWVFCDWFSAYL